MMRWFRRARRATSGRDEELIEVRGDRVVFWKAKSEAVEDEIYGPVWIADANDPNVSLEEPAEWVARLSARRQ